LEHEQLEVTQPTAQEDQVEVEELTMLKEESLQALQHLTLLFTRFIVFKSTKKKEEKRNKH
jgi:hypothetical protein